MRIGAKGPGVYLEKIGDGAAPAGHGLIHAVLAFLEDQRLDPTPLNYSFAYHVVSEPAGALALEVARRTDGGIRLTTNEVEQLGNAIDGAADVAGTRPKAAPVPPAAPPAPEPDMAAAEALVTETLRPSSSMRGSARHASAARTERCRRGTIETPR